MQWCGWTKAMGFSLQIKYIFEDIQRFPIWASYTYIICEFDKNEKICDWLGLSL